jgi:CRISPR type III-associated protein (TIGR04423 family)
MKTAYKKITKDELPLNIFFEGYYWYANKEKPEIIIAEPIQPEWFKDLPFIVEANFYARTEKLSIQVKNIDGEYHIAQIDFNQLDDALIDKTVYIGHDTANRNYLMYEAWDIEVAADEMSPLVPTWSAFAGFVNP